MKKYIVFIVLALSLIPLTIYAFAPIPFGGKIMGTKTCDEGLLITLKTSKGTSVPYMWIWGNLPYLSRNVPHMNQNVLGIAKSVGVPCTISGVPYAGGLPILFHGSSY